MLVVASAVLLLLLLLLLLVVLTGDVATPVSAVVSLSSVEEAETADLSFRLEVDFLLGSPLLVAS